MKDRAQCRPEDAAVARKEDAVVHHDAVEQLSRGRVQLRQLRRASALPTTQTTQTWVTVRTSKTHGC